MERLFGFSGTFLLGLLDTGWLLFLLGCRIDLMKKPLDTEIQESSLSLEALSLYAAMIIIYYTIYFLVCRIIICDHFGKRWRHTFMRKTQELKAVQRGKY
tara:strand:+ start:100 stop:399 length:300 start_codon:yes stop_codon:yes gene_type:complete